MPSWFPVPVRGPSEHRKKLGRRPALVQLLIEARVSDLEFPHGQDSVQPDSAAHPPGLRAPTGGDSSDPELLRRFLSERDEAAFAAFWSGTA